jgi:hypothetical protein
MAWAKVSLRMRHYSKFSSNALRPDVHSREDISLNYFQVLWGRNSKRLMSTLGAQNELRVSAKEAEHSRGASRHGSCLTV